MTCLLPHLLPLTLNACAGESEALHTFAHIWLLYLITGFVTDISDSPAVVQAELMWSCKLRKQWYLPLPLSSKQSWLCREDLWFGVMPPCLLCDGCFVKLRNAKLMFCPLKLALEILPVDWRPGSIWAFHVACSRRGDAVVWNKLGHVYSGFFPLALNV